MPKQPSHIKCLQWSNLIAEQLIKNLLPHCKQKQSPVLLASSFNFCIVLYIDTKVFIYIQIYIQNFYFVQYTMRELHNLLYRQQAVIMRDAGTHEFDCKRIQIYDQKPSSQTNRPYIVLCHTNIKNKQAWVQRWQTNNSIISPSKPGCSYLLCLYTIE